MRWNLVPQESTDIYGPKSDEPRYSRLPSDTIVTMTLGNLREFARETREVYFVDE